MTKEITHSLRLQCIYCVRAMGVHMHVHSYTCVRAEQEKVISADIAPKRSPLSSQTQPC